MLSILFPVATLFQWWANRICQVQSNTTPLIRSNSGKAPFPIFGAIFDPAFRRILIIGRNQAYLALPCNDPWHSGPSLNLQGDYLVPEPFGYVFVPWLSILLLRFYAAKKHAQTCMSASKYSVLPPVV